MRNNPNILFIINHDLSRRAGCYGNAQAITPNIDRLAARGLLFESHYCNYALCGPSRANLLTGCRPETTRRIDNTEFFPGFRRRMGAGFATLPEHFKNNGYFTQALGQVLHGQEVDRPSWSVPQWWPESTEVPDWAPGARKEWFNHWIDPQSIALMRRRYDTLMKKGIDPCEGQNQKRWRGPAVESGRGRYAQEDITDRAIRRLADLGRNGSPFFLGVGYEIGHTPWYAPKEYWDLYDTDRLDISGPQESPEGSAALTRVGEPAQFYTQDYYDGPFSLTTEQSRELLHGAYASLSYFDGQVGRILKALDNNGLAEDTIVVTTSDHGISWGEHGYWGKHDLWEASLSIPLIISGPGLPVGATTLALTEHVDVYPTLCELCGLPLPLFLEGASAVPAARDADFPWKQAVFASRRDDRSVRTRQYRYSEFKDASGTVHARELFDYREDPFEAFNLAGRPAYRDTETTLAAMLNQGWEAFPRLRAKTE